MDKVKVVVVLDGEAAVGVEEVCNVDSVEEVKEVVVVAEVVEVVLHAVEQQLVLWADDARDAVLAVKLPPASAGSLGQRSAYHEIAMASAMRDALFQARRSAAGLRSLVSKRAP